MFHHDLDYFHFEYQEVKEKVQARVDEPHERYKQIAINFRKRSNVDEDRTAH